MRIRNCRVAKALMNRALAAAISLAAGGIATPSAAATTLHGRTPVHSDTVHG